MTITYGLTPTGLVIKTIDIIRGELIDAFRLIYGASIDTTDGSIEGQIIAIVAEREALIWELAELVYKAQDPDAAFSQALDQLCLMTGTFRPQPTKTAVILTWIGTPTTLVAAGTRAKTVSTAKLFASIGDDATIVALPAWSAVTSYAVGARVTNAGNAYVCKAPILSATVPGSDAVHWRFMGAGIGAVDANALATETGAIQATSGDITAIDTPVGGLSSVINLLDGTLGSGAMSDQNLRMLRSSELATAGNATPPALLAKLLDQSVVPGVISATVFENKTDVTNSDGIPPHAIEALVRGGSDADVIQALYNNVGAGIRTYGSPANIVTGTITDSQGQIQTYNFSRPALVPIYIDITLTYDASLYPVDGDSQVKIAIAAYGNAQKGGRDAVAAALGAQSFGVAGVLDNTTVKISAAPLPTVGVTIPISLRQLATYDTSRITVHSSAGTP